MLHWISIYTLTGILLSICNCKSLTTCVAVKIYSQLWIISIIYRFYNAARLRKWLIFQFSLAIVLLFIKTTSSARQMFYMVFDTQYFNTTFWNFINMQFKYFDALHCLALPLRRYLGINKACFITSRYLF